MSRKYLIGALGSWVAVGGAILTLGSRAAAPGLWGGWATAGLSGAVTFGLLAWSAERHPREVMGAIVLGFLCRMALLALGLLVALHLGAAPLWFCVGFFSVYLPGQFAEIGAVLAEARRGLPSATLEVSP